MHLSPLGGVGASLGVSNYIPITEQSERTGQ
jgi:hypothetical protein